MAIVGATLAWSAAPTPASAATDVAIGCTGPGGTAAAGDLTALRDAIVAANDDPGPGVIRLTANCTYSFVDAAPTGPYANWYGPAALPAIAQGGGGLYNLGYLSTDGQRCQPGSCTYAATTTVRNSIISNSSGLPGDVVDDVVANRPATVAGGSTNSIASTVVLGPSPSDRNIVPRAVAEGGASVTGSPITADPMLRAELVPTPASPPLPFTPVPTHALWNVSPALDAGATDLEIDARGAPRPSRSQDDIGAFEHALTTPAMTLAAEPAVAGLQEQVRARATLTGGDNLSGNVTFTLHGPTDTDCTGTPIFTSTTSSSSVGNALSGPSPKLTTLGTHRWKASFAGNADNPISVPCGAATLEVGRAAPTLAFAADPTAVGLGEQVRSYGYISGPTDPTGTVTFALHGPSDATCTDTPVFTATVPVTTSQLLSGWHTPAQAGTHRWVVSYSGDALTAPLSTRCGAEPMTVQVAFRPTLVTRAVPDDAGLGQVVHAEAELIGATSPTGTVTFRLHPPLDDRCQMPIFTSTVALGSDGTATSEAYETRMLMVRYLGTYRWTATYSGDANNLPSVPQACGAAGQNVEVGPSRPGITAVAVPAQGPPRSAYKATATVAGSPDYWGDVLFQLHGPGDLDCSGSPVQSQRRESGRGEITDAGLVISSEERSIFDAGTYRWKVTFEGKGDNGSASTTCGGEGLTVDVLRVVPTLSITGLDRTELGIGGSVRATAAIAGTQEDGLIHYRVQGPVAAGTPCDPTDETEAYWTVAVVNADGSYTSNAFEPDEPGTYWWWVEFVPSASNRYNAPATDRCNPTGRFVVTPPAQATSTIITTHDPDPSLVGQSVTVAYEVDVVGGAGTPTGSVTVTDGVDSCTGTVSEGGCTLTLSTLGSRTLVATYAGTDGFSGSTSAGTRHHVVRPVVEIRSTGGDTVVGEGGPPDTFTIALGVRPTADVTVDLSYDGQTSGPASVTFTPEGWNDPQTVTVTAVQDDLDEADPHPSTITFGVISTAFGFASDAVVEVDGSERTTLDVAVCDDDTAGVTLAGASLDLVEGGAPDTYTVALTSQPTGTVTITPTATGLCTVSGPVTFGPDDWSIPKSVTVTPGEDDILHVQRCTVSHAATSSDPAYQGAAIDDVVGPVAENDVAGVRVSKLSLSLHEGGEPDTYTLVLLTQPSTLVTVTPAASGLCSVSGPVTFTAANWNVAQTVTVTPGDDDVVHAQLCSVSHTVTSGDGELGNRYQTVVRSVRHAGLMFGAYGVGATVGPALVALTSWRVAFLAAAVLSLVAAALNRSEAVRWPAGIESPTDAPPPAPVGAAARAARPRVPLGPLVVSLLCFAIYCSLEAATGAWTSSYFEEHRGTSARWAGLAVSGFWAGVTLSRLAMSRFRAEPSRILAVGSAAVALAYVAVPVAPTPISIVAVLVAGAALAVMLPTLVVATPDRVGAAATPRVTGYQLLAANAGGTGFSAGMGLLVARFGDGAPGWAFAVVALLGLPLLHRALALHPQEEAARTPTPSPAPTCGRTGEVS